jgi:hypothetical protein
MDALNQIRKKGSPSRAFYFAMLGIAVVQTLAAMVAAYGSTERSGLFLFCSVPFFVVAAYSIEQARANHAILKELDELRALMTIASSASEPNYSLKRTDQSLRD